MEEKYNPEMIQKKKEGIRVTSYLLQKNYYKN